MTERGLPIVDGAPACPFVAFDDDRDERASSPDHRHRCYAEAQPAPRALAHQEAYCLSSAFPICPTFQDWARREAARERERRGDGRTEDATTTAAVAAGAAFEAPEPPRRNPPRDWLAPPPWSPQASPSGGSRGGIGLGEGAFPGDDEVDAPGFLAGRARPPASDAEMPPLGLAAASAGHGSEGLPETAPLPSGDAPGESGDRRQSRPDPVRERDPGGDRWGEIPPGGSRGRREPGERGRDRHGRDGGPAGDHRPMASANRRQRGGAPEWERPRRDEAYPSLRTRVGLPSLPSLPRVGVMAAALLVAAVALFFLPALLGVGDTRDRTGAGGSPSPSAAPTVAPTPTPTPAPTPQIYVVRSGDSLGAIARRFGLSLEALLAANPQITNPDRINIGDEIIIPAPPPDEIPNASLGASPAP